jgi:cytosine/adenosine deaminase-related metal-dependent hydrolase
MIKIFAANWILTGKGAPLQNHAVVLKNGKVFDIGTVGQIEGKYSNRVHNLGNTIIFPAFVNAHTHLELTALRNQIDNSQGFLQWMRSVSDAIRQTDPAVILQGIHDGIRDLYETGTIGIGDVTHSGGSVEAVQNSHLYGRVFHEVQGFRNFKIPYLMQDLKKKLAVFEDTEKVTNHISPHSSFLVGRKLFKEIEQRESLISLHLASIPEEVEFLKEGGGPIKQILLAHEMYDYMWETPGVSPVRYFFENYYYAQSNILVHMIHVSDEDMDYMAECNVDIHICLCPRSHKNLGLGIAPARQYKKRGMNLCLGTDNIVSSGDFDMRNEMREALDMYDLDPEYIFAMATAHGAKALNLEDKLGTIEKGKCGHLLAIQNEFAVDKNPYEVLFESNRPVHWLQELEETELHSY